MGRYQRGEGSSVRWEGGTTGSSARQQRAEFFVDYMAQAGTGSSNDGCENIDQDLKSIGMGAALNELLNDGEVTSAEIALIPGFHDTIVA